MKHKRNSYENSSVTMHSTIAKNKKMVTYAKAQALFQGQRLALIK